LLYVEERFCKIATCTLEWTTGQELFDGFEEVLLNMALMNWEDHTAPIPDADETPAQFDQTFQAIYRKYVSAEACVEPMVTILILQDVAKAKTFLILALAMVAVVMPIVATLSSILSKPKLTPSQRNRPPVIT
jgi:hypothetical protein